MLEFIVFTILFLAALLPIGTIIMAAYGLIFTPWPFQSWEELEETDE